MKSGRFYLILLLLLFTTLGAAKSQVIYIASTPADKPVRSFLGIPYEVPVDFIRWELTFQSTGSYVLLINYGEGQPNTSGFKKGGIRDVLSGKFTVTNESDLNITRLTNDKNSADISLVKLNDNLMHLLTTDKKLLKGNGGWSYTLNRKAPVETNKIFTVISDRDTNPSEVIYEGRTPCKELATEYNYTHERECMKLKWLLTLKRDPATNEPTIYTLSRTLERSRLLEGKWISIEDKETGAAIIRLDPDKPAQTISLLRGDENVLFFLDKNDKLFTGNADFSYTLNRREK